MGQYIGYSLTQMGNLETQKNLVRDLYILLQLRLVYGEYDII
jgi:hypothetical protein